MNFYRNEAPSIFKNPDSLQISCLKSLSKSLDRVILCGSEPVATVLQKCVHVLQRLYSSALLKVLSDSRLLQDQHLEFLINRYLTEIEIEYLRACSRDTIIHRFAEVGYVFHEVNFCLSRRNYESLEQTIDFVNQIVSHLQNVTVLKLHVHCNNTTLRIIFDSCPKLEELYIFNNVQVSNIGLYSLCRKRDNVFEAKCSNLRILHLLESGDMNPVKFVLKHVSTIEKFDDDCVPKLVFDLFQESCHLENIRKFNLTTFTYNTHLLNYIPIKDVSLIPIMCPRLKTLTTSCGTESDVEALSCFAGIENLAIHMHYNYSPFENQLNYNHILKTIGSVLKQLHLETCFFSVSVLIQNCTNLEYLNLRMTVFQLMGDDKNTAVMSKLVELHLDCLGPFDDVLKQSVSHMFDSCPNLKRLYLRAYNFIDSATMLTFLKKSCPNFLSLLECEIHMDLLEDIIKTTASLQTLCIVDCGINERSIQHLGKISTSLDNFVNICWSE